MSELMIDLMNQEADEWIRERLDDQDADEDSDEYKQLAKEYSDYQEFLWDQKEFEDELQWLKQNGSSKLHQRFVEELNGLKRLANSSTPIFEVDMLGRMTYAHSITLLEAYLSDTAKFLIRENDKFLKNALSIDELKNAKYPLDYLVKNKISAVDLATKELSDISFHNVPKVRKIFEAILGMKIDIDISKLSRVVSIRHDIVHRNGKTKDGELVRLVQSEVLEVIEIIEVFASDLQRHVNMKA